MKLGAAHQNHDLVFATAEGGPLSIQNFSVRHFKPTLTRAKLQTTFTLYSLRHSCATLANVTFDTSPLSIFLN